jgi:hypothetical protein
VRSSRLPYSFVTQRNTQSLSWDAGSARLIEAQGASAIATTSAGFAWALGYPDGRMLPFDEVIASVRRIVRVLEVPLSVDVEYGYADDPQTVADHVMRLVDLGVAGINIEDGPDAASRFRPIAPMHRPFTHPCKRRSKRWAASILSSTTPAFSGWAM